MHTKFLWDILLKSLHLEGQEGSGKD